MKKSKSMRLASALLVLTLLSTCMISGTFAKYTTSGEATDSARVAKWGVTIESVVNADDDTELFVAEYAADDTETAIANTVSANEDVVAPGTKCEDFAAFTISGTAEVAVEVTYDATLTLTGWEVDGAYYCPLVFTVGTETIDGASYTSTSDFIADVEEAIEGCSEEFEPGDEVDGDSLAIGWSWPFSTGDDNDALDTKLGEAGTATINLTVTAKATQID